MSIDYSGGWGGIDKKQKEKILITAISTETILDSIAAPRECYEDGTKEDLE